MKTPICIGGAIAQRPGYSGHAWMFIQWLKGLEELGFEPCFIDALPPQTARGANLEATYARWLEQMLRSVDLDTNYILLKPQGETMGGLTRGQMEEKLKASPVLLNFMGYVRDEAMLAAAPRRAFLDIDPGFGQMWAALELHDPFTAHEDFITVGRNIGSDECEIPDCGRQWIGVPPPVHLESWPPAPSNGGAYSSIGTWRGPFDAVEYQGRRYGLRAHSLRPLIDLPQRVAAKFELALDIDESDAGDIERLRAGGWGLSDPRAVGRSLDSYRQFVRRSKGELMVAKEMYVATRSAWFSDRSVCYLASARPVIAQDTGFSQHYPCGEGLLAFSDLDGAAACIEAVKRDWWRHSRTAREMAEELFDARKVLGGLLQTLGVS